MYRCRIMPSLRYHITTGRWFILCRYRCGNTRKTKNMPWFWEMSEKKLLCLPSLLNCVCLKGIKCRYFWDNLQWHLQEFAGEKAPLLLPTLMFWLWMAAEGYQIILTTSTANIHIILSLERNMPSKDPSQFQQFWNFSSKRSTSTPFFPPNNSLSCRSNTRQ